MSSERRLIEIYHPVRDCRNCGHPIGEAVATIAIVGGDFEVSYSATADYEIFSRRVW